MSIGLLCLGVGYLLTRPGGTATPVSSDKVTLFAHYLDWRVFAVACAPLALLTYQGRGYNNSITAGTTTSTDLAATFLTVLIALAAFGFLLRNGMRWFVVVLVVQ